ncbi:MAG: AAA family ATPase, partial [Prevotella sp.]|nr:AAA family ATPase [Prevotella sp.]
MIFYYIIPIACVITAILFFILLRNMYKHKLEELEQNRDFDNLEKILEHDFCDQIITQTKEKLFTNHYSHIYNEAYSLQKKLGFFHVEPSAQMLKLIDDFKSIPQLVKRHNEFVIKKRLENNREFFDHCLTYPLDEQQRRSIVSEEANCLVVSSAGSGKTSSIVGKVKYLIERKGIDPKKILLISYTNKAAAELTERMGIAGLRGYTFHKLALDLIGQVTGQKPTICENTDALFVKIYHDLLPDKKFQEAIITYFIDYQIQDEEWEKRKQERRGNLSEMKNARIKALLPDMDRNDIYVKSEQEKKNCFVLSSLGVKFRYEEPYEHQVADEMHSQYRPDFSIYYEKNGKTQRIYLEHFAVDEHGMVPVWFAKDRGIT